MNGTLNSFPLSDDASSVETPNGSRDMMSIRNIVDSSYTNSDHEEELDSGVNLGNQISNLENQLSYGSNLGHHLPNGIFDESSSNDADDSSSNNTTEANQQGSLDSIRVNSQETELLQSQEQQQQEIECELEQQRPAEQHEEQEESSEDTEPEQQPVSAPAPAEEGLSIWSRHLPDAIRLDQTPFAHKIDLVADYQDSVVIMSSDETYGAASNLIKTVAIPSHTTRQPNEEDEFRDGWLVKRHEESGYATIRLGVPGTITGIDIDCTGYTQCAPLHASVHGNSRRRTTDWTVLVDHVPLVPNAHNFFQVMNNTERHTHVHFTVTPGGGVARLRCYGDIPRPTNVGNMEVNMASSKMGAEIVQKPDSIVRGEFPNLIINRKVSSQDGWISPRVRGGQDEEREFTVIKLAGEAEIDRIAVDTVHFIGNAPEKVILEGCCITAPQDRDNVDSNPLVNAEWKNLVTESNVLPNSYNCLPCIYNGPITHVRYRPVPNGGVNQILVKGSFFETRAALPQPKYKHDLGPHKKRKRHDENEPVNDENYNRRKSSRIRRPVSRYQ